VPKYAALSNPGRFCVNLPTTSNPNVFASWRSSASEASNSRSLTLDNCTAATMARFDFWAASCVMVHAAYQQSRAPLGSLREPMGPAAITLQRMQCAALFSTPRSDFDAPKEARGADAERRPTTGF
jgi:hypothetical protein